MRKNVLILEDDLKIALKIATMLERRGETIVGMTADQDTAFAIAEGEEVDCTALSDSSSHQTKAEALRADLGVPTILSP